MKPPSETVSVILPRPLVYKIRSAYDPAVATDLLRMLGCAQKEQSFMRMAGWPSMGLGLLIAGTVLGIVHPLTLLGWVPFALCCGAIGRFSYCMRQYTQWRAGIWNADPEKWKAIADELQPWSKGASAAATRRRSSPYGSDSESEPFSFDFAKAKSSRASRSRDYNFPILC